MTSRNLGSCLSLRPSSWWIQTQPASRGHCRLEHQGSMFLQQMLHPLRHLSSPKEFLKRMNKFETEGSLCHCQLPRRYISELVISMRWRPPHQGPRHHSSTSQNKATISQPVVSTRWRPSRQGPRHRSSYILISKVSWCICYVRTWRGEEG